MPSRRELANAIRFLAMDAVQQANSGHPGMPMGMADIAEVLWRDHLVFNPKNPNWFNRDRFVMSNGHGAMLQYALLHLTGYDLSIDDLKQFRQLHSKTPGHPEFADTPGVETTTGPLGQGLANAVGMALAEKLLANRFNCDGFTIVDHFTYALIGDGCLMEGISHEAASLAGTLGLGKLIVLYDDNNISIDGDVSGWFSDDTEKRFDAYGWQVIADVDGHDSDAIHRAITAAKAQTEMPTIICCKTTIGFGSPAKAGTAASHGAPLGAAEIEATRHALAWPHDPFVIPEAIYAEWDATESGRQHENDWNAVFSKYESTHPEQAKEFLRRMQHWLPENWQAESQAFLQQTCGENTANATRKSSLQCLNAFGPMLPELIGGSADLSGSNCTNWSGSEVIPPQGAAGNYIEYGVREFGMAAIMNGLALHGGFIPYGGTFLVFSDYARNAIRLSAIMRQKVIYVLTHDSIGLGEDGPTHQPIEHAAMLRMTPNVQVWRPADLTETAVAWQQALEYQGPSCLLLTRQNVAQMEQTSEQVEQIKRGAYVAFESQRDEGTRLEAIIIATGSEVEIAITAAQQLSAEEALHVRVVSMPCCERFKAQDSEYHEMILPADVRARVAIEAGVSDYWYQFVGLAGKVVGIDQFGASAPAEQVYQTLGVTVAQLKKHVMGLLHNQQVSSL